jgi:hypothetical protein
LTERGDLQRLLKANIEVVAPDVLVVAEEFGEWEDSKRRIDLLGIDRNANLVVIELKRDDHGGHMELQAIRYAAMVSSMRFERAVDVYQSLLDESEPGGDARTKLLDYLGWEDPRDDEFAQDVRIILVSGDFSKELTTAVLWLNDRQMDIRCVRLKPYLMNDELVIDAQQVVPLPEAEEYQVKVRERAIIRRESLRQAGGQSTGYWFMNVGDCGDGFRVWEDCRKYGFMIAGGGLRWINAIKRLRVGDKLFAYLSKRGYVGFGEVLAEAVPLKGFVPPGESTPLIDLPTIAKKHESAYLDDLERCDWCAAVKWFTTRCRDAAVKPGELVAESPLMGTVAQIRNNSLVNELLDRFKPEA